MLCKKKRKCSIFNAIRIMSVLRTATIIQIMFQYWSNLYFAPPNFKFHNTPTYMKADTEYFFSSIYLFHKKRKRIHNVPHITNHPTDQKVFSISFSSLRRCENAFSMIADWCIPTSLVLKMPSSAFGSVKMIFLRNE